jgi:Lipase (class 3)
MAQNVTARPEAAEHTENPTYPITNPPPGYMANARVCSFLVNVACDMGQQWIKQGQPSRSSFKWVPNDPCPYTSSQHNLKDFTFIPNPADSLIWSTFQYKGQTYTEPFGFNAMAKDGSATYLVFRGSQTSVDFDLDGEDGQVPYPGGPQGVLVEQGFAAVYAGCLEEIEQALLRLSSLDGASPLYITGHSLGSALATLAVPLMVKYYANGMQCNQASPRVGNPAFATYIDSFAKSFPTYRLVNTADLVPKLPPPVVRVGQQTYYYQHAGAEVDFTAAYPTEKEKHSPCCCYSYALFNPASPVNPDVTQCVGTLEPFAEPTNPKD